MPFLTDQAGDLIGILQRLTDPGMIMMYGNAVTPPGGWVFCDGSLLLKTDYPQLFGVIGSSFNIGGEAPTDFRLPDFRSRSPIGTGQGTGLSLYAIGARGGEETHVLITTELASHTHTQNSHNHTQDAHTHVQDAHTHVQDVHNHTQDTHTHTQNSHNHTQNSHNHTQNAHTHTFLPYKAGASYNGASTFPSSTAGNSAQFSTDATTATNIATTATNQAATATNQNTIATNQSTTATNQNATATNQNTTATNQATTATNQNTGSDVGHNTIHPVLAVPFIIKLDV